MFSIIGIVVVIAAVLGGYLMHHGKIEVLIQPNEFVIIWGAALGSMLISTPLPVLIRLLKGFGKILSSGRFGTKLYLETLQLLNDLFQTARKNGMMRLEQDVDKPGESELFKRYPGVVKDHHALEFICDTLRVAITGGIPPHDLDQLIDADLEVHHEHNGQPVHALTRVSDALPGLGIVAAVLGIVITMESLGGPPEELGKKVAAALVGTFLGILTCYGFVGPLASAIEAADEAEAAYYRVLKTGLVAFVKGHPPILALEFARRTIPHGNRPSFAEMEAQCKKTAQAATGQPPILVKKVVAGGGHHGGAWKVAYADFVTAMMALFMVLWLMNADQETKEAVSAYFQDPKGVGDKLGSGQAGSGSGLAVGRDDMQDLAEHIQQSMQEMSQFESLKEQVEMTVTATGLRIELLETEQGMFFQSGSPTPSEQGREILALIVAELNKLPNKVALEGHTDSKPFRGATTYSNWELSVDRANGARRIMVENGFPIERIAEVRGFADRQLRFPDEPELPANRRISLIVMYDDPPAGSETASGASPGPTDSPGAPASREEPAQRPAQPPHGPPPAEAAQATSPSTH